MPGGKRDNAGRPKGSRNRKTLQWSAFTRGLMAYSLPRCMRIMRKSKDAAFMEYFFKFLRYIQARPRDDVNMIVHDSEVERWLKMSNEELARQIEQYEEQKKFDVKYNGDGKDE